MDVVQRIVVTGAAGFIGRALVHALHLRLAPNDRTSVEVVATDLQGASIAGDIGNPTLVETLFNRPVHRIFHLAGIVSGRAEADFVLGKRVNLDATLALLERCRLQSERGGPLVCFVYASSIAVFGRPLPETVTDATAPLPTLSYGTHKRVVELLIDDYSRRGCIDGRALRLSGVLLRPAVPNGALSSFNSDLIREPLAGRAYACPVGPDASVWITSLRSTIGNLLTLADADEQALGAQRCVTAPALVARVGDIVAALGRIDAAAPALVSHRAQPAIEAQFGRWPHDCSFDRARALGLNVEASLDALLETCLEDAG